MIDDSLHQVLERFTAQRVLIIGEAMLDVYLHGRANRICQEAPVPIVTVGESQYVPGGAANVAVNVAALGAEARFLSVSGEDPEADTLLDRLKAGGVHPSLVRDPARGTLAKRRVLADGQLLLRFDQGTTSDINGPSERELVHWLEEAHAWCDAMVVSDYGYGILTAKVRHALAQLQCRSPRVVAVDARDYRRYRDIDIHVIKPNRAEALALVAETEPGLSDVQRVLARGEQLLEATGAPLAAVTLDREGAVMFERGRTPHRVFARSALSPSTAGAGDTYIATLAVALSAGASAPVAAELAGAAADTAVAKPGTAVCAMAELRVALMSGDKGIATADDLALRVQQARETGARVVMTSGCFDILHRGHVAFLSQAKALGDVLIVALNSDSGVERLKGLGRPINPLDDRSQVLAAMSCVDFVIPFDDETPMELIRTIRPDMYAKGGDYVHEMLPEADVVEQAGGEVVILPYVSDLSTSRVIDRVQQTVHSAPTRSEPPAKVIKVR
jgi:D-beta-D-heptose 7-phosphate kinase / D-beta-D-heptose 1-phosphate adenosyltransferase